MTSNTRFSMAVHIITALTYLREKASSELLAETVRTNPVVVRRLLGDLNRAGPIRAEHGKMVESSLVRGVLSQHLLNAQNLYKCELASVSLANIANEM